MTWRPICCETARPVAECKRVKEGAHSTEHHPALKTLHWTGFIVERRGTGHTEADQGKEPTLTDQNCDAQH